MDEPRFPPPRAATPYRAPEDRSASDAPPPPRAPLVVMRPEPPPASDGAVVKGAPPKLTPDEVRALLQVSDALEPKPWGRVAIRGGVIMVPTGAISFVLQMLFGSYSIVFVLLLTAGALAWVARPLYGKKAKDWG